MYKILTLILLFISVNITAQKTYRHSPVIQKGFYLTFNPHSIFEPEQGAIGMGIGNRISRKFEIWTEFNYLYKGFFYDGDDFKNLKGIRNITQFRYYYSTKHGFFVGAEFRLKHFSYNDRNNFVNRQTNDTLSGLYHTTSQTLVGGALLWGKRFKLTGNGKFEMEANLGIGAKNRTIKQRNVLQGYEITDVPESKNMFLDHDTEEALPYFPITIRFIYHL
jgi:hypothetical protein